MSKNMSLVLRADSYKPTHFSQLPPKMESALCYLEPRKSKFRAITHFGLQGLIKKYFLDPIEMRHVDYAEERLKKHFRIDNSEHFFNRAGWERIVKVHGGRLPIRIRAVPEGMKVPAGNVMLTVENTDPECAWLPSYLETPIQRGVWYPSTVTTYSEDFRDIILDNWTRTADDLSGIDFAHHDFGTRGVSSAESAEIGGCAHLVSFQGTDNLEAVEYALDNYHEDMAGYSIAAMEHNTIISWGPDGEEAAFQNMIDKFAKSGRFFACVSDTNDFWNAVDQIWGKTFRGRIIESGAILVVRPDSGDPVLNPTEAIRRLSESYGYKVNSKGFKVLDHTRVIQGDGIDRDIAKENLDKLEDMKFSGSNIAFGEGGGLLQKHDRDENSFAYKMCNVRINGKDIAVCKNPSTDPGKRSKAGRLDLVASQDGSLHTVTCDKPMPNSVMRTVYEDGELLIDESLATIRNRARMSD